MRINLGYHGETFIITFHWIHNIIEPIALIIEISVKRLMIFVNEMYINERYDTVLFKE